MTDRHIFPIKALLFLLAAMTCQAQTADPWTWSPVDKQAAVTLLLLGDFNVQKRDNPADALKLVQNTLNQADLVYANLEGLLVESQGPDKDLPNKSGWTHLGPESVQALGAGNIAVVGVANNVAYGRENIMASLSILDTNGIAHTGAGANIEQAHQPAIIEIKGTTFGFLQYTAKWYDESRQIATSQAAGVARLKSPDGTTIDPADLQRMLDDIHSARPLVDVLVVSAHTRDGQGRDQFARQAPPDVSGAGITDDLNSLLPVNEALQQVEPYQKAYARAAIDAGADIVFGHGCHMLQQVEVYKDKPILHCLGNFASDWIRVRNYRDGMLARVVFESRQLKRVSLVPVSRETDSNNVTLLSPGSAEGERLYSKLKELSPAAGLVLEGRELILMDR